MNGLWKGIVYEPETPTDLRWRFARQNVRRNPICMIRGALVLSMRPGFAAPMLARGVPRLAWLKALNISQRYCNSADSLTRNFLNRAQSRFQLPGPLRMFRPAFP